MKSGLSPTEGRSRGGGSNSRRGRLSNRRGSGNHNLTGNRDFSDSGRSRRDNGTGMTMRNSSMSGRGNGTRTTVRKRRLNLSKRGTVNLRNGSVRFGYIRTRQRPWRRARRTEKCRINSRVIRASSLPVPNRFEFREVALSFVTVFASAFVFAVTFDVDTPFL